MLTTEIKKIKTLSATIILVIFVFLLTPVFVFSASPVVDLTSSAKATGQPGPCTSFILSGKYCLLTGAIANIPAEINIRDGGLSDYLRKLYQIGVAVATGLALIYITIGGLQYSTTDSVTGSSQGRETIKNALVGLLVVLASYVMLNAINPQLLNSDLPIGGDPTGVGQNSVSGNTSGIQIINPGSAPAGGTSNGAPVQPFGSGQSAPASAPANINNSSPSGLPV